MVDKPRLAPDGDMGAFMRSLDVLARRDRDVMFLPGHGDPVLAPAARIAELRAHRWAVRRKSFRALEDIGPAGAVGPGRAGLHRSRPAARPKLAPMAERNVLAHLIDLWERGHAAPAEPFSAKAAFRLAK